MVVNQLPSRTTKAYCGAWGAYVLDRAQKSRVFEHPLAAFYQGGFRVEHIVPLVVYAPHWVAGTSTGSIWHKHHGAVWNAIV